MSNENFIGVSKIEGGASKFESTWHKLMPGDNFFRVLPPFKSLAESGRYSAYYATHTVLLPNGKRRKFICTQEMDRETKAIKVRCPYCDARAAYDKQASVAQQNGVDKAQLDEFKARFVKPFDAEKRYYVNVISVEGKIGILSLPYTAFQGLKLKLKELKPKGIDPTGMKGLFLNFKKIQERKGDRDTNYSVDVALEALPDGSFKYKFHELTNEIIESMKTQAVDLGKLFKTLTVEEINALASAEADNRGLIAEKLFAKPEKNDKLPETSMLKVNIPNTTMTAVSRVEVSSEGINVVSPMNVTTASEDDLPDFSTQELPKEVKKVAKKASTIVNPNLISKVEKPVKTATSSPEMSDDDFLKMFRG